MLHSDEAVVSRFLKLSCATSLPPSFCFTTGLLTLQLAAAQKDALHDTLKDTVIALRAGEVRVTLASLPPCIARLGVVALMVGALAEN